MDVCIVRVSVNSGASTSLSHQLQSGAVIERSRNKVTFSGAMRPLYYIEAFECREVLEGLGARKAADLMTVDAVNELRSLFMPFKSHKRVDMQEYRKADQIFHETIMEASNNNLLKKLNRLGNVLIRTFPKGILMDIRESLNDHFNILNAIENKNPDKRLNVTSKYMCIGPGMN